MNPTFLNHRGIRGSKTSTQKRRENATVYFFSILSKLKVSVPQYMRARICTGTRGLSSEYQIQILPFSLRTPEDASGWTRKVLNVPAGVLICSRASTFRLTFTVWPPSLSGKRKE